MSVKLAGKMPPGERDGLQSAEGPLSANHEPIVVVALLYPRQVAEVLDSPDDPVQVTCGLLAIEMMRGADAKDARALLEAEQERRTGRPTLPLDADDDG